MLELGKVYRVTQKPNYETDVIEGFPNFNYETHVPGFRCFAPRRGINDFKPIKCSDGSKRTPVIILHSGDDKNGRNFNPWHDEIRPDRGMIKYFGDNKPDLKGVSNNPLLLNQIQINHMSSRKERLENSVPIVCLNSNVRGLQIFQGYGIVESAEVVTQYAAALKKKTKGKNVESADEANCYFSNYLFNICIFKMSDNNECFDWKWIADRCNPNLSAEEVYKRAPDAWKYWIDHGISDLHLVRRNVYTNKIVSIEEQRPQKGSDIEKTLKAIYSFYNGRKHDFEALALEVTKRVIEENGARCTTGWTTKRSGDGGVDFVLRIDVGYEFLSGLQIVVLGQAKCEKPSGHVNGMDIARTVARLKRGWVGSFVTLQTFSENVQREVLEDNYPLLLINGSKVAEIVIKALRESGCSSLDEYLDTITKMYPRMNKIPEDILG